MNKSVLLFCSLFLVINCDVYLENFQENTPPIYTWEEMSDTVMPQGKSKSSFVLLKTENISRAILFTLLDPQVGGAGFAGIRKKVKLNLTDCEAILMNQKGQGQYKGYEICLRHYGKSGLRVPAYCFYFQATEDFKTITMPLDEFKPYIEGKIIDNYPPLDKSNITQITILFYGGAHLPKNLQQSGTASLAINWIKVN